MPTLIVVDRKGNEKAVTGESGLSVMEVIRDNGFDELLALCGGSCSCATCHIHVDSAWSERVGSPHADEADLLDSSDHRTDSSRLACQIHFSAELDGLKVTIAQED